MAICNVTCKKFSAFTVGSAFIVLGMCFAAFWNNIYYNILRQEITISNGTKGFNMWKETPIPMYMSVYLYNWTNSKEVLKDWRVKPKFEECGPYVFLEHHSRSHFTWNSNYTVTHQQKRTWHFLPEMSVGQLDENITSLNPVADTIAYFVRGWNGLLKKGVNLLLEEKERQLVITKKAGEWMFDGFDDELLALAKKLKIPGMNMDKFGWFYARNTSWTADGTFTMNRGINNLELLGVFEEWNGDKHVKYYRDHCGDVNGTSGELWPPVKDYDEVYIFSPDICSSIKLFAKKEPVYYEGVAGKKFVGTDFFIDNGTKYPEQACFTGEVAVPNGVRDVSKCKFGAPAFVSLPHFYLADPSYLEAVEGLSPNPKEHTFSIALEPNTGVPLNADAKLQINLLLQPDADLKMFKNVKPMMFPMMWFSEKARLDADLASQIKTLIILPQIILYTGVGMIAIGLFINFVALYITLRGAWCEEETQELLSENKL